MQSTRRSFLGGTLTTTLLAPSLLAAARWQPVRLGGPVFVEGGDPDAYAEAHRAVGYAAAYCPNIAVNDTPLIQAYRRAFAARRVVVAEVGRWVNLMDADPVKRAKNLQFVTEGLALAEEVGALCCVDIAGSRSPKEWYGPHPDNVSREFLDTAVENARKIIDAVKPRSAKFCYEMMGWALPDSAESSLTLMKAVDRKAFGIHLDPCNLVNSPRKFYQSDALLRDCFRKLGRHIVSCHAKDLVWEVEMNVHFREVRPGQGSLNYRTYLRELASLPQQPPLMLEHLPNAAEYDLARRHIQAVGAELDLPFA